MEWTFHLHINLDATVFFGKLVIGDWMDLVLVLYIFIEFICQIKRDNCSSFT